jgi:SagB-type dehydrogenase family enzyme
VRWQWTLVFSGVLSMGLTTPWAVAENGERQLPAPQVEGRLSIERALQARRSIREYAPGPLTLTDLSQVLWAAQGITDSDGSRTAPSAGGLYPLEVYVVVGDVAELSPGIYRYRPRGHTLRPIAQGDRRPALMRAALGQPCIVQAAAVLLVAAVYERTTVKYGTRGTRYAHMEAGHAAQNVYLQAVSLQLGTVAVGAFDDQRIKAVVGLREEEQPLYLLPLGHKEH